MDYDVAVFPPRFSMRRGQVAATVDILIKMGIFIYSTVYD
jgi:hypothetical protein